MPFRLDVIKELNKLKAPRERLMLLNANTMVNDSKMILVKGLKSGEKQTFILTGSENFYKGGLESSNNVVLKFESSTFFKDYWGNSEELKS